MATTSAPRPGIITWVNALRTTMANDPGRQTLHDQVQTNGFLFLDEYLDNILAGPKHDPIIELVKTPGRRKDLPKKTRAATAAANKAKTIITLSLEDDDYDKENSAPASAVPINSFHKKLLEAKAAGNEDRPRLVQTSSVNFKLPEPSAKPASEATSKDVTMPKMTEVVDVVMEDDDEEEEEIAVEKAVTPPRNERPPSSMKEVSLSSPKHDVIVVDSEPPKELSMIVEDEEVAERSRSSIARPRESASGHRSTEPTNQTSQQQVPSRNPSEKQAPLRPPPNLNMMEIMDIEDMTTTFTASTSGSTQTFHSINLDSPIEPNDLFADQQTEEHHESKDTHIGSENSKGGIQASSTPFRAATPEEPPAHSSAKPATTKPGVPHFPTIGAPSPLRKSMRAPREPSMTANHPAPGQKPGLTRSSWLVKAREAKAMEENAKRVSNFGAAHAPATQGASGSKRKSDTMAAPLEEDDDELPEELERKHKLKRISEASSVHDAPEADVASHPHGDAEPGTNGGSEGIINMLKKTVEGFRAGKSMGKSLGGATATALAEARAAAEARIAERNGANTIKLEPVKPSEDIEHVQTAAKEPTPVFTAAPVTRLSSRRSEADRRLSVSDLVTKFGGNPSGVERVFKPPSPAARLSAETSIARLSNISTSTTPPDSPPPRARSPIFTLQKKPSPPTTTFSRPPPADTQSLTQTFEKFTKLKAPGPLSAQSTYVSTQSSAFSESIFDHEPSAWMPETQDTQFSDPGSSHFTQSNVPMQDDDMDADESWRDDKLDAAWMPALGMGKDDSMTWSSAPTQSVRGDTGTLERSLLQDKVVASEPDPVHEEPREERDITEDNMDVEDEEDDDYAHQIRLVPSAAQSTASLVSSQDNQARPESQASNANSQTGFLGTAARLMTSVLGGSKNRRPEPVKSLQLAAAAAKKQQEAEEKKATRLKEMEARRQQVHQKKVDEEKLREEKKAKEDMERRKREREDLAEKRALKQSVKVDEEATKKRKVAETEKKAEITKPAVPEIKKSAATSKIGKPALTQQPNASQSNLLAKSLKQSSSTVALNKSVKLNVNAGPSQSSMASAKAKGKGKALDDDIEQPALTVQAQMQARVKAQLADLRKSEQPAVPSESIELPDINSEYSDSDDEDRVRTFDPPNWAQSPELRAQLQSMSTMDPDDIFGAIKPLKMEELFKTRTSRFRARTSSANWAGTDELTAHEEREYAKRMGYKK
ncbi:hypothetical protein SCHPADRAFT_920673 [Schizopora paradoxa]|uniref:Inner centromere protein ARK-binding domain-containing protein n=1 Tax=Schizopora paradoxa TaxID=27342 RepID=A0A0H2RRM5_9AGAM|nr:hypothetical protein SCHPADRAFT_920673 [Schizopora paradoxa]